MNSFLIDIYVRSILFGVIAILLLWIVRKKSASAQHGIACVTLLALLALPALRLVFPELRLSVLPKEAEASVRQKGQVSISGNPPAPSPKSTMQVTRIGQTRRASIEVLVLVWLLGFALVVGRYALGLRTIQKWVRQGEVLGHETNAAVLVSSSSVRVPMTAWLGRHIILLPPSWEAWDTARRESALSHELAHVRRRDWFTQLATQIACAILWPNPFVWMIARRCRTLAERSADDMVLESGVEPAKYAQDLLEIAREVRATLPELSVCMARNVDVARRIELVLKTKTQRGSIRLSTLGFSGLALVALALPVACTALAGRGAGLPSQAKQAKTGRQAAHFRVDVMIVKPGTPVESAGLTPLEKDLFKYDNYPTPTPHSFVFLISDKTARVLMTRWNLVSMPSVQRSDMMMAHTTVFPGKQVRTVEVGPRYNYSPGSITVEVCSIDAKPGSASFSQDMVFDAAIGSNVLVAKVDRNGQPIEAMAIVKCSIADSKGP